MSDKISPISARSDPTLGLSYFDDLVWPDPERVFKHRSGIKPMDLACPIIQSLEESRCDQAKKIQKAPRPVEIPWNIVIVRSGKSNLLFEIKRETSLNLMDFYFLLC